MVRIRTAIGGMTSLQILITFAMLQQTFRIINRFSSLQLDISVVQDGNNNMMCSIFCSRFTYMFVFVNRNVPYHDQRYKRQIP